MKKISNWKKCAAAFGLSAMLFAGTFATAWAAPSAGISINDNINVRDSANGNVVGKLAKDQQVSITQESQASDGNTWYEITFTYNGTQMSGWVRSDLINTDTQAVEASESQKGTSEGEFYNGGTAYNFSETMPEEMIPDDFTQTSITYDGKNIQAAKFNKADVTLVCLEQAGNASEKSLFVYDKEREGVSPFSKIESGNQYVIVTPIPLSEAGKVSSSYLETKCDLGAGTVMAYQKTTSDLGDIYYVYGVSNEGKSGWYEYNEKDSTIQSTSEVLTGASDNKETVASTDDAKDQTSSDGTKSGILSKLQFLQGFSQKSTTSKMIIAGGGVIFLLLIILVIVFSIRYHRLKNEEDEEDLWDEENPEEVAEHPKKKEKEPKEAAKTTDIKAAEPKEAAKTTDTKKAESKEKSKENEDFTRQNKEKNSRKSNSDTAWKNDGDGEEDFERPILPSPDAYQKKGENGMWEVELPNETVDLMDLDEELPELGDIADYVAQENQNPEPDFYDEEDGSEEKLMEDFTEISKEPKKEKKEDFREEFYDEEDSEKSTDSTEWDDDIEFLD